jgi:metal-sulfur cluster biosynthetic enzyme
MESINELVIESEVLEALRTCFDPEIPVNIYELGLIYSVNVEEGGAVTITMTLTSPHCPAAQSMPAEIEEKVKALKQDVRSGTASAGYDVGTIRDC